MLQLSSHTRHPKRTVYAVCLVMAVTLCLWFIRDILTLANFSLIYLLLTLIVAVWLGTIPSLITAFISFFCFNYFLIEPYYTLAVEDPRDLLELFIFLLVALITGQLTAYAHQQTENAHYHAEEQNILYEFSSSLNRLHDRESIYHILCEVVQSHMQVTNCTILDTYTTTPPDTDKTTVYLLLSMNEKVYGTLRVVFTTLPTETQHRFLMACVVQATIALQRIELADEVQRNQAIEEADKLKTTLLHAVSHDLRTPITIIKTAASNLQALHQQISLAEKEEMTQVIIQEADHLDRLVGNLLDMSRLQAGALVLHEDWTAVSEIAGDVAAQVYQRHDAARIHLDFPDDLPLVRCDQALMLQALSNITDNVLRYEPPDQQVEIRGSSTPQEIWLTIVNHGPTIPTVEKERIMEPFYHGRDGHVGLGLAISKGIVVAHHGRIWVEDTPGGGATFVIALPQSPMEI